MALILRQLAILLTLALAPALVSAGLQLQWRSVDPLAVEPLAPGEVRAAAARLWGEHALWVDTREMSRFNAGHVPGAVRLTIEEWEALVPAFFEAWDAEKTIVIYGDAGPVQPALAERMRAELKLQSVYTLHGGWSAWKN